MSILLLLLCGIPAHAAGPFGDWRDWRGAWPQAPGSRSPTTSSTESRLDRFQLEKRGDLYLVWFENPICGPVEVELRYGSRSRGRNRTWPELPRRMVVQPRHRELLTQIHPAGSASFGLDLRVMPGAPGASAADYPYVLPFDAADIRIEQSFGGELSHSDPANFYAVDFALAEGTPVRAAREGTIMQIHSDRQATAAGVTAGLPGYFIRILHADGSMALYGHLQEGSARLREGQRVTTGQPIAKSGNTGLSSGPHLHFVVQVNRGMRLESVPFRLFDGERELKFPHPSRAASSP
jgi:murein DD-endopeptidase MepM/ murein hydrolase activator NlpD